MVATSYDAAACLIACAVVAGAANITRAMLHSEPDKMLNGGTIIFLQHQGVQVCLGYATQIDGVGLCAIRLSARRKRLHAAVLTEQMLDFVFIELVSPELITAAV